VNIWLNGEQKETAAADITSLVESLHLPAATLLIEHNGLALRRDEWPLRALEIIRIVAGG
jgi:sulfur carrier protein ThiS